MTDARLRTTGSGRRLPAGQVLAGRYTVDAPIGEGAQGVVYVGRDKETGSKVALKILHRHLSGDPRIAPRFKREAEILKRIDGEHVVKVLDLVESDGDLVLVLEYVEGRSLEDLLKKESPLDPKRAVEVALQICAALGCAHAAGVVHRDLKPANVLVEDELARKAKGQPADSDRGPTSVGIRVRVVDFGLAKVVHGEHTTTALTERDMVFGTPEYMPPELVKGEDSDARADLYSLGCMLYEMTVGRVPFSGRTPLMAMTAHLTEPVPTPRSLRDDSSVSPALEAVILRALAKEAADRFGSAREMAEALAAVRDEPRVVKPPVAGPDAVISTSDTDLNVIGAEQLASMKTLPVDSNVRLPDLQKLEAQTPVSPQMVPRTVAPAETVVPRTKRSNIEKTVPSAPSSSSRLEPPKSRSWMWIAVAVVFGLVGVLLGAIIGAKH